MDPANQTTSTGASNAQDFQPPTSNPQAAPGQVFPSQNSVQEGATNQLLESSNAQISVPVNPAPVPPAVTVAKSANWPIIFLAVAIGLILLSWHLWRRRKIYLATPIPEEFTAEPEPTMPAAVPTPVPTDIKSTPDVPKRNAAKTAKRKNSKRRKRARK